MTNLSPAARATYDAFNRVGFALEPSFETDRKALAAAIRTLVEQVEFPPRSDADPLWNLGFDHAQKVVLNDILNIADELEEISYGTYRCPLPEYGGK